MKKGLFAIAVFLVILIANLLCGSVSIPAIEVWHSLTGGEVEKESWRYIIMESRVPQSITAMLCGANLAVSGLLLQTAFRNPLAGPSILGITNGASVGVALVMLILGGIISFGNDALPLGEQEGVLFIGSLAVVIGAFLGSLLIIFLLLAVSSVVSSSIMLLIVGIMVSYLASSIVMLLNIFANADNLHSYVMWGMGSFSDVTLSQLPFFSVVSILGLLLSILLIKPLNALLLGEGYATNLGINTHSVRRWLLIATGILTATATAYCGPVAFIGLAVPHIARLIVRTSDHRVLLPATMLCGASIALLCNIICQLPENLIIPLNAVTPIFGAPVIIYIIFRKK
ncbi:MAG: iron ABC transporter permease [Prevotella sp.]|nr:iron ABC transporter permease [Prevotella sp.]